MRIVNKTSSTLGLLGLVTPPFGVLDVPDAVVIDSAPNLAEVVDAMQKGAVLVLVGTTSYSVAQLQQAALEGTIVTVLPPVSTLTQLRALDVAGTVDGTQIIVIDANSEYAWNALSMGADDDSTIIKPDSVDSGEPGRWLLVSGTGEAVAVLSVLTYDPSATPTRGVYTSWEALWEAYEATSGAVVLHFQNWVTVPPRVDPYVFRIGETYVTGVYNLYDPSTRITVPTGAVLQDLLWLDAVQIRCESDDPCLTYSQHYPNVRLQNGAQIRGANAGTASILWTLPHNDPTPENRGFLNLDLQSRAMFLNDGGPVIDLQGSGPSDLEARCSIRFGQSAELGANTIVSNTDAALNVEAKDITARISLDQPGYQGDGSPLDPNGFIDLRAEAGFSARSLQVSNNPYGLPNIIFAAENRTTVGTTPVSVFSSPQALPQILSLLLEGRVGAREATTGATATWVFRVQIQADPVTGVASLGPKGVVLSFDDATAGATTWTFNFVLNSPSNGNIDFLLIGEAGKTISWNVVLTEVLVFGL